LPNYFSLHAKKIAESGGVWGGSEFVFDRRVERENWGEPILTGGPSEEGRQKKGYFFYSWDAKVGKGETRNNKTEEEELVS